MSSEAASQPEEGENVKTPDNLILVLCPEQDLEYIKITKNDTRRPQGLEDVFTHRY